MNKLNDNIDGEEDDEWNNGFIKKDNNKNSKVVKNNNQKYEKNDGKSQSNKIRNNIKNITEFNNDMSKYAKNICFKEFKVEDYNSTDIIIIYNEIRNDEFKKNIR